MSARKLLLLGVISTIVAVVLGVILTRLLGFSLFIISRGSGNVDNMMPFWFEDLFIIRPLMASACALIIIVLGLFVLNSNKDLRKQKPITTVVKIATLTIIVLVITATGSVILSGLESGVDLFYVWSVFFFR
jgi:hypothetical protein